MDHWSSSPFDDFVLPWLVTGILCVPFLLIRAAIFTRKALQEKYSLKLVTAFWIVFPLCFSVCLVNGLVGTEAVAFTSPVWLVILNYHNPRIKNASPQQSTGNGNNNA